jgi:hypothetical protein
MNIQNSNIVEQINGGFISIDSAEEFTELLEDFPEDPSLHRAYADLLVKKNSSEKAALSYCTLKTNSCLKPSGLSLSAKNNFSFNFY